MNGVLFERCRVELAVGASTVSGCRLFSAAKMGCLMRTWGLLNDIVVEHGVLVGERSRPVGALACTTCVGAAYGRAVAGVDEKLFLVSA